jgi:hypothetical protein
MKKEKKLPAPSGLPQQTSPLPEPEVTAVREAIAEGIGEYRRQIEAIRSRFGRTARKAIRTIALQ